MQRIVNQSDENITSLDVPFSIEISQRRGIRRERRISPLFVMMACGLAVPYVQDQQMKVVCAKYGDAFLKLMNQMEYLHRTVGAGSQTWNSESPTTIEETTVLDNNDTTDADTTDQGGDYRDQREHVYPPAPDNRRLLELKNTLEQMMERYKEMYEQIKTMKANYNQLKKMFRSVVSEGGQKITKNEQAKLDQMSNAIDILENSFMKLSDQIRIIKIMISQEESKIG